MSQDKLHLVESKDDDDDDSEPPMVPMAIIDRIVTLLEGFDVPIPTVIRPLRMLREAQTPEAAAEASPQPQPFSRSSDDTHSSSSRLENASLVYHHFTVVSFQKSFSLARFSSR